MKLCLTIGVSKAPPLSHLPGAITVAHEMGNWARQAGFITEVITDEDQAPVTVERIRETLLRMLPASEEVELFVLHFAGHGFRTGAEQNIWLPSDWFKEMRAISVEALKRQLYRHGIKSLTIFGDACRSLPSDIEIADIFGDPVLPRGPYEAIAPIVDRFNAVVDGQQAFMLKGDATAPARCVFSTVLVEGLCGLKSGAFDKYLADCVIPESLALFSQDRLREIGEAYDLKCAPEFATGIPREHAIYFRRGETENNLPLPKWPAPPLRDQVLSENNQNIRFHIAENDHVASKSKSLERQILNGLRKSAPYYFNLLIQGSVPKRVWSKWEVERCSIDKDGGTYRVHGGWRESIQVLVEFEDGVFGSAVVYPHLCTLMSRDEAGEVSWTCVAEYMSFEESLRQSTDAIASLQTGSLSADQVDDIATKVRLGKHINPILGAIASYLYDYTGDIDSIRRMAFFYEQHDQAMPFDVAFMGLLAFQDIGPESRVVVPAVSARRPSPAGDNLPNWVTKATPEIVGEVAGFWPWLRQGWEFIEEPEPQEEAVAEGLRDVAKFLLPSQFSSFKEEGGRILINKFRLEPDE